MRENRSEMRAFIFGAGASVHADYPLARDLGHELLQWAESHPQSEWDYPLDPREFVPLFPCLDDFEEIVSELESPTLSKIMALPKWKLGRILAGVRNTIRAYFDSLRHKEAAHYQKFAGNIAHCGDVVVTFNYDVLLERELRQARKWEIGDGYGFEVCTGLPASPIMLLKLHGSTTWSGLMFEGKSVMHGQGPLQWLGKRPVIWNMHSLTTNFGTDVSTQTFGQWTGGVTAPRNVQMGLKVVF